MNKRALLYSLPVFAALAEIAVAHNSLAPHSHPHGVSPLLGTWMIVAAALAGLALLLAYGPARNAVDRILKWRRK
jgi:hypothetical protein